MSVARSSGLTAERRASISSSGMSLPPATSVSTTPASIRQMWRRLGSAVRTDSTLCSSASLSTTTATAPESDMIHSICSLEEVT
jgi:hypothetical protein